MLTKRQLEDATRCCEIIACDYCSMSSINRDLDNCNSSLAKTALTYMTMLEQLATELREEFDAGVFHGRLVGTLEEALNKAEALLKESEEG